MKTSLTKTVPIFWNKINCFILYLFIKYFYLLFVEMPLHLFLRSLYFIAPKMLSLFEVHFMLFTIHFFLLSVLFTLVRKENFCYGPYYFSNFSCFSFPKQTEGKCIISLFSLYAFSFLYFSLKTKRV